MTTEEFDETGWTRGMHATHRNQQGIYPIASVDFEEKLVGLKDFVGGAEPDHIHWVRCENIELIKENASLPSSGH